MALAFSLVGSSPGGSRAGHLLLSGEPGGLKSRKSLPYVSLFLRAQEGGTHSVWGFCSSPKLISASKRVGLRPLIALGIPDSTASFWLGEGIKTFAPVAVDCGSN